MKRTSLVALLLALVMLLGMAPTALASIDECWEPEYTVPPSCFEQGYTVYTNFLLPGTVEYRDYVPAYGSHDFHDDWSTLYEPTCETDGMAIRYCHRCQQEETRSIPALGHQWDNGQVTKEPKCYESGVRTYTCTRVFPTGTVCGATRTESIPTTSHNWELRSHKDPTCTEGGYDYYGCANHPCNADRKIDLAPLGHDWDGGTVTKQPTETEEGIRTYTCRRDPSHTYTEAIPKLPSHQHQFGDWFVEEKGNCVRKTLLRHKCSCGADEYMYGDYGDHDWGEWEVVTPAAPGVPGLERRVCKIEPSHVEERAIPALPEEHKVEIDIDASYAPGPYGLGESFVVTITVTNTGNVTLTYQSHGSYGGDGSEGDPLTNLPETLEPGETWTTTHTVTITEYDYDEEHQQWPNVFGRGWEVTYVYVTPAAKEEAWDEYILHDDLKDNGPHPELTLKVTWAPNAGEGKRYKGAKLYTDDILTNTGNCDLYVPYVDKCCESLDAPHPKGAGEPGFRLAPGETMTLHNSWYYVTESQAEAGIFTNYCGYGAYYLDKDGGNKIVSSNDFLVDIPLTYPDGEGPEEKKPAITLHWDYDDPDKDVYQPEDKVKSHFTVTNTGNVPLKIEIHRKNEGISEYDWYWGKLDPGESNISWNGCCSPTVQGWVAPNTETEDLLGVVHFSYYAIGYDPDTGEELCRSETVKRDWKVAKPGPTPWEIPSESAVTLEYSIMPGYESADPAGYQLGEKWRVGLTATNTGKVTLPANSVTRYDPYDGYTDTSYYSDWLPGETHLPVAGWNIGVITEEDVARGYIYLPPVEYTWDDPDSGETMPTAKSNELTLLVINQPGLLLEKKLKSVPGPLGYFQEGDTLEWELKITNTSKEPIRNVVVTDQGETVGTFAEIGPGEQYSITLSTYKVTDYDVGVGEVKNYFTATGTDIMGAAHTWVSNFATAPTDKFTPIPPPDPTVTKDDGGDPIPDPGDPMGPVYGLKVGAKITKEEVGGPLNGQYYELNETVNFVITVKNTGEVPLENVQVFDSLGGLAPIGTAASIAPNAEVPFTFPYTVQQSDIDFGWVINSATASYEFDGGKPGTPVKSDDVKVKAGDKNGNDDGGITGGGIIGGGTGHFTPIPGGTPGGTPGGSTPGGDPGDPTGGSGGPQSCELRLTGMGDSEADYTLHACGEHTAAAKDAEAACLSGDWAGAERIWREAVEKMYETFYEAADAEGKTVLVQERAAFLAYADTWKALAGDEAAAELMRLKCADMCCIIHTLPQDLPSSIVGSYAKMSNSSAYDATARVVSALQGSDSKITEQYSGAEARALADVISLLAETRKADFGSAFVRAQRIWQVALDSSVNEIYKAADKETRKKIIAWRTALDTLVSAEAPLMEMLYPDSSATVQETVMNLYKDAAFDVQKVR